MPVFAHHGSTLPDWCHLCGARSFHLADAWYPANAEHASAKHHRGGYGSGNPYLRICRACTLALTHATYPPTGSADDVA